MTAKPIEGDALANEFMEAADKVRALEAGALLALDNWLDAPEKRTQFLLRAAMQLRAARAAKQAIGKRLEDSFPGAWSRL